MKKKTIKYKAAKKAPTLLREVAMEEEVQAPTITMLDLRHNAESIVRQVERGRSLVLTYRGRPAVKLEPFSTSTPTKISNQIDPIYRICELAKEFKGDPLTNEEMDKIIYEH